MMLKKKIRISELIIPKYHKLFNDTNHGHHILTSGRAGSKSSYAAIKAVFEIISDKECSVIVLRKHHNKLRKTVYKEMLRGIARLGLHKKDFKITKSPMEITYKKNGNTIYFTGSDSVDDTKGIIDENKPIKLVILDELTEFFEDGEGEDELANIEATFVRGNDDAFQMLYLYNPPKNPNAPIVAWCKKMEERRDCLHIHTDYRDVPVNWLGKQLIRTAEAMAEIDRKLYEWVWLGLCIGIDELIYYMFDAALHIYDVEMHSEEDKKSIGEIGIGCDYGQKNPTIFEVFAIDYKNSLLRGLDEYYHCGRETRQKSPSEYAKDLKCLCDKLEKEYSRVVSWIFIDPSAAGLIEEARRVLPHITIVPAKNDVKLGISRVQKLLSYKKLLISSRQPQLIRELGLYQYDSKSIAKGKEEPLKEEDHCCDGTRYLCMGVWNHIKHFLPMLERE